MKSSSIKKLRKLLESEVEQAESIIAARGFSQELQSMLEKLGRLLNEDLPAVAEQMRHSLGADTATSFENQTTAVIQGVMDQLRSGKQSVDNSVAAIGEGQPISDMPAMGDDFGDELDDELGDELLDIEGDEEPEGDEDLDIDVDLDIEDEEESPLGRARKESVEYRKRKIKESDDHDAIADDPKASYDHAKGILKGKRPELDAQDSYDHAKDILKGKRVEEDEFGNTEYPYVCVHAKKGKFECDAKTTYEAAKKAAEHWGLKSTSGIDVYRSDIVHTATESAESKHHEDMAMYSRAYKKARSRGDKTFKVGDRTYKIVGDREDLEEMDRMCEKFLEYSVKTEDWVQEKIIKANDYLNTIREYLEHKALADKSVGDIGEGRRGRKSADYHIWKNILDNKDKFVVRATKGLVKNDLIGSYDTIEDAREVAKQYPDAKIFKNLSGKEVSEAKKSKVKNPYAVGMAQAMKTTGDQPPLKTHGDEYKEKDKYGDGYKIKGPRGKLPESELDEWDELERRAELKKHAGDQPLLKAYPDYKEKDKYGDGYKIKGPRGKLPESELDEWYGVEKLKNPEPDHDEFYDYVLKFYGDGGLYDIGATREEVEKATDIVKNDSTIEFEGDSIDRERVRDVIVDQLRG